MYIDYSPFLEKKITYKHPYIKFQPLTPPKDVIKAINSFDDFKVGVNYEKFLKTAPKHPLIYKTILDTVEMLENDETEKYWVDKFYEAFPNSILAKIYYATSLYWSLDEKDYTAEIIELFIEEIAYFIEDRPYSHVIDDSEMIALLNFLFQFFQDNGQLDKAIKIFEHVESLDSSTLREQLSFEIKGEIWPYYEPEYFYTEGFFNHITICLDYIKKFGTDLIEPNFIESYILLNKAGFLFDEKDFKSIEQWTDKDKIEADIIWVLENGFKRLLAFQDQNGVEFLKNALYVSAYFEIDLVAKVLYKFIDGLPAQYFDLYFEDLFEHVTSFPYLRICQHSLEGIEDIFFSKNPNWMFISILSHILALMVKGDFKTTQHADELLNKAWQHYEDQDLFILNWIMHGIIEAELTGYEDRIKRLYEIGVVDEHIHDAYEESSSIDLLELNIKVSEKLRLKEYFKATKKFYYDERTLSQVVTSRTKEVYEKTDFDPREFSEDYEEGFYPDLGQDPQIPRSPIISPKKIGRNETCPCGSGKKYKKCCLNLN